MKSYGRRFVSFVWRGDIRWVQRNLYRRPFFYGLMIGWVAIGVVVFPRDKAALAAAGGSR